MGLINGHKKFLAAAAGIAALCSILSFMGGTYNGWTQRVEASVTVQRMVNQHDETLKLVVPKVETCHTVNEIQQVVIDQQGRDMARVTDAVQRLVDKMDLLIQSQMREGRIPR